MLPLPHQGVCSRVPFKEVVHRHVVRGQQYRHGLLQSDMEDWDVFMYTFSVLLRGSAGWVQ